MVNKCQIQMLIDGEEEVCYDYREVAAMTDEKLLMYQAAVLYYEKKRTQQEIAQSMGLSRQTVSKLLGDAIREGIVEIRILNPECNREVLSRELCGRFQIREAVVCGVSRDDSALRFQMTVQTAAKYILPLIKAGDKNIAVSWGRTVQALIRDMIPVNSMGNTVFPMLGATDNVDAFFLSNELARILADKIGANLQYAWFPYLPEEPGDVALLKQTGCYKKMENLWKHIDLALVGIGNVGILERFKENFGSQPGDEAAVGDVATHFFTENGNLLELYQNALCASAESLKKADTTVAVACGDDKITAIAGALRTGLIDVLITDEYTAAKLLK